MNRQSLDADPAMCIISIMYLFECQGDTTARRSVICSAQQARPQSQRRTSIQQYSTHS